MAATVASTLAFSQLIPATVRSRLVPPSVTTTPPAPTTQNRAPSWIRSRYLAAVLMVSTLGRGPFRRVAPQAGFPGSYLRPARYEPAIEGRWCSRGEAGQS